ncbi:hypothetical protein H5P31_23000 [Mycobacterium marseillense]|nr:hypothetical protein [Mycobacterium marseillense]
MVGQNLGDAVFAGLLPAADGVGFGDQVDLGAVGGQHVAHDGFHAGVGDYGDRVPVGLAGQR